MYLDIVDLFENITKVTRKAKKVTVHGVIKDGSFDVKEYTYIHLGVAKEVQTRIKGFIVE